MSVAFTESPIPRYLQIADLMRQRIARGQWAQGDKLPSLEALVEQFGVSRVTVGQVLARLEQIGAIQRGYRKIVVADRRKLESYTPC